MRLPKMLIPADMLGSLLAAVASSNLSGKTDDMLRIVAVVRRYSLCEYLLV